MLREPNNHVGHVLDHPIKIKGGKRVDIHIGSGVHEVDGVGNAIADSPLEGIHIVPQGTHKLERILDDATTEFGAEMVVLNIVFSLARIVLDGQNFILSKAPTR